MLGATAVAPIAAEPKPVTFDDRRTVRTAMPGDNRNGVAAENFLGRTFTEEGRAGPDAKSGGHKYPAGRTVGAAQFLEYAQRRDRVSLNTTKTFGQHQREKIVVAQRRDGAIGQYAACVASRLLHC